VVQNKKLLDKAARHNAMKKLILEEESQQLVDQMKLLDEEEKLLESMLTQEQNHDQSLMEHDQDNMDRAAGVKNGKFVSSVTATVVQLGKPLDSTETGTKPKTTSISDEFQRMYIY